MIDNTCGPDFVPIWTTDNLTSVTKSRTVGGWMKCYYGAFYDGTQASDCEKPCTAISVEARLATKSKVKCKSKMGHNSNTRNIFTQPDPWSFESTTLLLQHNT